jgi:hypothetical protein
MVDRKTDPRERPLSKRQRLVLGTVAAGVNIPISGELDTARFRPHSLLGRGYLAITVKEKGQAQLRMTEAGRRALAGKA